MSAAVRMHTAVSPKPVRPGSTPVNPSSANSTPNATPPVTASMPGFRLLMSVKPHCRRGAGALGRGTRDGWHGQDARLIVRALHVLVQLTGIHRDRATRIERHGEAVGAARGRA